MGVDQSSAERTARDAWLENELEALRQDAAAIRAGLAPALAGLATIRLAASGRAELAAASVRTGRARIRLELRTRRDEIRQHSIANPPQGPPPPVLRAIEDALAFFRRQAVAIDDVTHELASLRAQVFAASAPDRWVSQREPHPLPTRERTRLCRELRARGDDRATVVGRIHFVRESALNEAMRGSPAPRGATPLSAQALAAADWVRRELAGLEAAQ